MTFQGREKALGVTFGLSAVVMWALYFVYARQAALAGLLPSDVALLRYGGAGLALLPWLLRKGLRDLGGVGWGRGILLALLVGPLFIALGAGGFQFAPLAHGAVLQPSTAALVATVIALAFLGEKMDTHRGIGIAMVLGGIGLIAITGAQTENENAWIGHLMFMGAGALWAGFTIALRLWQLQAIAATAAISVLSAAVIVPAFITFDSFTRMQEVPTHVILTQIIVHGLMAGVLAMVAYAKAVALLGVGAAALFPAVVPAVALLLGIPLAGETPTALEALGALLATAGLAVAMHAIPGLRRTGGS